MTALIPVHNGETVLTGTVKSVLEQTECNVEVMIVDDGSSDETPRVARALASDSRVRVITLLNNCGRAVARNAGVAHSQGQFIAICDAGDFYVADRFARSLALFASFPNAQMVAGQIARPTKHGGWWLDPYFTRSPLDVTTAALRGKMRIAHPAAMLRKNVYAEVGNYHPALRRCEDLYLTARIADKYGSAGFALSSDLMTMYDRPLTPTWTYFKQNESYRTLALRLARQTGPGLFPVEPDHPPDQIPTRMSPAGALRWVGRRITGLIGLDGDLIEREHTST